jgi:hypothetical protein
LFSKPARQILANSQAAHFDRNAEQMLKNAEKAAMQTLAQREVKEQMCARRVERRAREDGMAQLPKWDAIRSGTTSPIQIDCASLFRDELIEWDQLYLANNLDGLMQRYPLHKTNCFGEIAQHLQYPSKNLYLEAALARISRDQNFRTELPKLLEPLSRELV